MPYIHPEKRKTIDKIIDETTGFLETDKQAEVGEVNYIITKLLNAYLKNKGINYKNLNECVGVLECAKIEFYRRLVMPYEQQKMMSNGDVYDAKNKTKET